MANRSQGWKYPPELRKSSLKDFCWEREPNSSKGIWEEWWADEPGSYIRLTLDDTIHELETSLHNEAYLIPKDHDELKKSHDYFRGGCHELERRCFALEQELHSTRMAQRNPGFGLGNHVQQQLAQAQDRIVIDLTGEDD